MAEEENSKKRAYYDAEDELILKELVNGHKKVLNNKKTNGTQPAIKKDVRLYDF